MKIRDFKSIQEAVVTLTHIQGATRILGNQGVPTARQVSFDGRPTTEIPSTDMALLLGVVRQLQQFAVTGEVTSTSGASGKIIPRAGMSIPISGFAIPRVGITLPTSDKSYQGRPGMNIPKNYVNIPRAGIIIPMKGVIIPIWQNVYALYHVDTPPTVTLSMRPPCNVMTISQLYCVLPV